MVEQVNIKEYLQMNTTNITKKKEPIVYTFEKIFDNGSDFIIERTTSNNIKRQLCFISNENLLFIRDPRNNKDNKITSERQIKDFFNNDMALNNIEFTNNFFNRERVQDFAYHLLKLHNESINVRRYLVKYGINPDDFIHLKSWGGNREVAALDGFPFDKLLKIIKVIKEFPELNRKDKEYQQQNNAEFLIFLLRIEELYSIEYVTHFLQSLVNSDSAFYVSVTDYVNYVHNEVWTCPSFEKPVKEFNLDFKRVCSYLFRDLYAQGIAEIDSSILETYYDCLNLQKTVYGKVKDKYPEHLKELHDKMVLIYNLNQKYFKEKKIEELKVHNRFLEMSDKEYSIIVAKTSEDLISEGINLHHCVGSYVRKVQDGECSIFFLRKTDDIDTSLITLEVVQDKILQVRGLCERTMDTNERKFVNKWCATKGLTLVRE